MQLEIPDRKYLVRELSDGFLISASDRPEVCVRLHRNSFRLWCGTPVCIGLIEYRRLVNCIAEQLMDDWQPPRRDRKPFPGIKRWAVGNTRRAIAGPVYEQWRRLLGRLDDKVVAVHKAVFAATLGTARITLLDQFYQDPFLASDVIRYRAAAVAARHVYVLARAKRRNQTLISRRLTPLREPVAGLVEAAETNDTNVDFCDKTGIENLRKWQDLFSKSDAYTSLCRTLMNLPGGIPSTLLTNLPEVRLQRPVSRRLELMTILLVAEQPNKLNEKVLHFASDDRIRHAMEVLGRSIGRRLNTRSTMQMSWFVTQLAEYPDLHRGNIVGLAEKVVKSQRDRAARRIENATSKLGADTQLTRPPIDLPTNPEIRFLETPAEICEEGIRMGHCVETLIPDAVLGNAFLFHVEKDGKYATVQVNAGGQVIQAKGPLNESNRACKWGKRTLQRWGLAFPEPTDSMIEELEEAPF